jgi:hypothetical protein
MVTRLNTGVPAREAGYEMLQYVAGAISADSGGATQAVKIGSISSGSVITSIISRVSVAITGGTPVLSLGTSSGGTQVQNTMAEVAGSEQVFPASTLTNPLTTDVDIWANISGAATTGTAYVAVFFIKPVA